MGACERNCGLCPATVQFYHRKGKKEMMDFDIFNDSEDEYASPEQREEMRELGINPDKNRKTIPFVGFDMGNAPVWGGENEARL